MRRIVRTVAAGVVIILGLALVSVAALGAKPANPLGRPSAPNDDKVQAIPPFNPGPAKKAGIPNKVVLPNSFETEFGKRGKHTVEVSVRGGAVYGIAWRDKREPEWGLGNVQQSRTVNGGFPLVQVAMSATRGIDSTCVITIDGEEKDTQSTTSDTPVQFCEA